MGEARTVSKSDQRVPDLSLVMPCYQEEESIGETAPALIRAFEEAGIALDLVMVDNGSTDRTGAIIDELVERGLPVRKVRVEVNRGYSNGIQRGYEVCTAAPVIGHVCADGQVSPEDVVRCFRLMEGREERIIAKVRRRFRQDDWRRKVISFVYNLGLQGLFGWLGAIDLNGTPKMYSRRNLGRMDLRSRDWFLDPEIIIKAKVLGLRVIEIDVEGYARHGGTSHFRAQTLAEFGKNVLRYRFGGELREFRRRVAAERAARQRALEAGTTPPETRSGLEAVRVVESGSGEGGERPFLDPARLGEAGLPSGPVTFRSVAPGAASGNRYHPRAGRWISVVEGVGTLHLACPDGGERREVALDAARPRSVYVPAGVAYALVNPGDGRVLAATWAETRHGEADARPHEVWARHLTPVAIERPSAG